MLQSSVLVGGGCGSGAGHAAIRGQALRGRTEGDHGAAVGGRAKRRADRAGAAHRAGAQIDGEAVLAEPPAGLNRETYQVYRRSRRRGPRSCGGCSPSAPPEHLPVTEIEGVEHERDLEGVASDEAPVEDR